MNKKGVIMCGNFYPYSAIKSVNVKNGNADWLKERFFLFLNGNYLDELKALKYLLLLEENYPTSEYVFYCKKFITEYNNFYIKTKESKRALQC